MQKKPIVLKVNGERIGLHPLKYKPFVEFSTLEVYAKNGRLLAHYPLRDHVFLALDIDNEYLLLRYLNEEGHVVGEDEIFYHPDSADELAQKTALLGYEALRYKVLHALEDIDGSREEIEFHTEMIKDATASADARNYIMTKIRKLLLAELIPLDKIDNLMHRIYTDLYGMGILQELDDDPNVGEIMVNAKVFPEFVCRIYYIRNGIKQEYDKTFKSLPELEKIFDRVIAFSRKERNQVTHAIIEATRPNRDRVNMITPSASDNWVLNIRKFTNFTPNLESMLSSGTITEEMSELCEALMQGKANVGIGGPMNTGKTTFMNFLLTYTNPIELKTVIASVAEVDAERTLKDHHFFVLLVDEDKGFTFERQMVAALRTTADRIIVPESRSKEFTQIHEANLKTRGNLFTAHALDDKGFMSMCGDMYLRGDSAGAESMETVLNKLAQGIDIVVIMRKVGKDIRLKSISEVLQTEDNRYKGVEPIFLWDYDPETPNTGRYIRTEHRLSERLKRVLNENGVPLSTLNKF